LNVWKIFKKTLISIKTNGIKILKVIIIIKRRKLNKNSNLLKKFWYL
jgi:hypothetical protein